MNLHITEKLQIVSAVVPVNLATAANNGDWVCFKNFGRIAVVVFKGIGTAGEDPVITLLQAKDVAGTGSKALGFTRIDKKVGTQTGIGTFTTSTSAAPAANDTFNTTNGTWTNSDLAENEAVVVIDVAAEDLDIVNGFDCIQASIADVGAGAQIGGVLYLPHDPRNVAKTLASAIIN